MKKILAILLSAALVLSLFSACGGTTPATEPAASGTEPEAASDASVEASAAEDASEPEPAEELEEAPEEGVEAEAVSTQEPEEEAVGDPFEAMKEEFISYPLEGDNTITLWYYTPNYVEFVEADFLTYAGEQALKFMTDALELNDENWNAYVDTCNSMGLPEIVAVYQNAYDEYLAGER